MRSFYVVWDNIKFVIIFLLIKKNYLVYLSIIKWVVLNVSIDKVIKLVY